MQLHEYEAKEILSSHGLKIPRGGLWPEVPAGLQYPVALKAQVLSGGRGKRAGVVRVDSPEGLPAVAESLYGLQFDGEPVVAVLVEEWIETTSQWYFALTFDRNAGSPVILASATGGVDIEERGEVVRLRIDPWLGPRAYHLRRLGNLYGVQPDFLAATVTALWQAFSAEDALLIEINPLGVSPQGPVALDARVFLDDNARFRHPGWRSAREGTRFEAECSRLGAAGVEMDGEIAIITSGAGLGMASLDLLTKLGGTARALIDLGPIVFQEAGKIEALVRLVAALRPRVLLFNFFLQLAPCDVIARGLAQGIRGVEFPAVIVRMKGVRAQEAASILDETPAVVYEDLREAFRAALTAAHR